MSNTTRDANTKLVQAYARPLISDETRRLIAQAPWDLYNGPSGSDEDYPGFTSATTAINDRALTAALAL